MPDAVTLPEPLSSWKRKDADTVVVITGSAKEVETGLPLVVYRVREGERLHAPAVMVADAFLLAFVPAPLETKTTTPPEEPIAARLTIAVTFVKRPDDAAGAEVARQLNELAEAVAEALPQLSVKADGKAAFDPSGLTLTASLRPTLPGGVAVRLKAAAGHLNPKPKSGLNGRKAVQP